MSSFTHFFFKNFAYFSGITILRNISEWQGSNAVLNHKEQMKDKKRKVIEAKTVKVLKECLWFKNYQQRNVFTTNRGSNEKPALKLAVTKFQK